MKQWIASVTMCLLAAGVQAEVHKCKDEQGKTYFSDRGCAGGTRMRGAPDNGAHAIGTKDDDQRIANLCVANFRESHRDLGADTTRLESYDMKWVSVRDLGARRLLTVRIGLLNAMGYWAGATEHRCLLRGDNVSFQTTPYELVN